MKKQDTKAAIRESLSRSLCGHMLSDDDDISSLGLVYLLFTVQIILLIEKDFQVELEVGELKTEQIVIVNKMAELIQRQTGLEQTTCTENYELARQEAVLFVKQHLTLVAQNIEYQQFIVPDIISCVAQAGHLGASISQKYGGRGYDSYQLCALHEVAAGAYGSLENPIIVTGMISTLL